MTLTPAQKRALIARESAWIDDGQFAPLDLSGCPSLNELPSEKTRDDGKFSKDWRDTPFTASASALRAFVSNPDSETLLRIGEEIGNPEYLREVRDRKAEEVVERFKQERPGYLPTAKNHSMMIGTLSWNALKPADQEGSIEEQVALLTDLGYFTVPNLVATFDALSAEGLLEVPLGSTRELSTAERLRVTRMAQSGRADAAIGEYLRCSLDGEEPDMDMLNDPAYLQACNAAVYSVFTDTQLDYAPTPEREAYLSRYAGSRPLTLALLQAAWAGCQAAEQRYQRGELLDQYQRPPDAQPPSAKEIDALSDTEVDRLYHDSLRAYVKAIRTPGLA